MNKQIRVSFSLFLALLFLVLLVESAIAEVPVSLEYARDLHNHRLTNNAKEAFITILHDTESSSSDKAEALYWLGQVSFEEGHYSVALDDCRKLVQEYAQTPQAKEITAILDHLQGVISQVSDVTVSSAIARSYIRNGDFWADGIEEFDKTTFGINPLLLPMDELAVQWYDKVINEFPGSNAAEIAYQRKLMVLIYRASDSAMEYASANSVDSFYEAFNMTDIAAENKRQAEEFLNLFRTQAPKVLKVFADYETSFPNSVYIQAFRYQIAQMYWVAEDEASAKGWLQKVIDAGKEEQTFYTETAKARLEHIKKPEFTP